MLEHVDTNALATALVMTTPQVVLLKAPTADWAKAFADLVAKTYAQTYATAIVELKNDGNVGTTKDVQRRMALGAIVLVSQAPETMLPASTLGAVDVRVVLPKPRRRWLLRPSSRLLASGRLVSSRHFRTGF